MEKRTDRTKPISFKKIKSIVPTNLKFNKLKVNPLYVIEGTKNKIGKFYKDLNLFNYYDSGHLDSLEIIRFNLLVEKKFKIRISPQESIKKSIYTLNGLASIILKKINWYN